ncbi:MAG TPA: Coq4 family protein, partial [Nannocystaceae bacterium]|nr:Coq4 family protein [Nannocystaceae bacterium]
MFEAFKKLKLASAFLGHSHEGRPGQSFSLRDVLGDLSERELESFGGEIDDLMSQPGVGQLYENRYLPPPESLDVLLDLPRDTLGYSFGIYLKRHRLKIAPAPADFDFSDRLAYIRERVRMTHALLHVVTGYDASTLGELAVQAYIVGQTNNLVSGTIIATGLITMIRDEPARLGDALQVMAEANERGRQARSFLGVPWEEFWTAPLDEIRDMAGIPRRTSEGARLDLDRL